MIHVQCYNLHSGPLIPLVSDLSVYIHIFQVENTDRNQNRDKWVTLGTLNSAQRKTPERIVYCSTAN